MKKLILASTSPYRAELLERLGVPFDKKDSLVDEDCFKDKIEDPHQLAKTLAFEKAKALFTKHPDSYVIGGDQIPLFGPNQRSNQKAMILGKPGNYQNCITQLELLESHTHQLITCTCVLGPDFKEEFVEITSLKMRKLEREEIERYVKKEKPYFCAGSYKIESIGISLFEQVQTNDFTSIIGLPLIQLSKVLRKAGFRLP
jgi:septum formation protein